MRRRRPSGYSLAFSHHHRRDICATEDPGDHNRQFTTTTVETYAPPQILGLKSGNLSLSPSIHMRHRRPSGSCLAILTTTVETYAPPQILGLMLCYFSPQPSGPMRHRRPSGSSLAILTTTLKRMRRGSPSGSSLPIFTMTLGPMRRGSPSGPCLAILTDPQKSMPCRDEVCLPSPNHERQCRAGTKSACPHQPGKVGAMHPCVVCLPSPSTKTQMFKCVLSLGPKLLVITNIGRNMYAAHRRQRLATTHSSHHYPPSAGKSRQFSL